MPGSSPEDPSPDRNNEVWAEVRGQSVHGTYSVSGGWVEVVADNGQYKTAQIGSSSSEEVAQRLLYELYARGSGAVDA
jgi:hypothetical protein